jgi:hypothetical protein
MCFLPPALLLLFQLASSQLRLLSSLQLLPSCSAAEKSAPLVVQLLPLLLFLPFRPSCLLLHLNSASQPLLPMWKPLPAAHCRLQ